MKVGDGVGWWWGFGGGGGGRAGDQDEGDENKRSEVGVVLVIVQELCESRGGRPGLSVLMSLTVSVDVKQH